MPVLLADKITHLTAARYFAARGFDWLCYDLSDDAGLQPSAVAAIREWVEGPKMALYLPYGLQSMAPELLEAMDPDGLVAGHFAPLETYPASITLMKEWRISSMEDGLALADQVPSWPQADFHILRCEDLPLRSLFTLLDAWRSLACADTLLLTTSLDGPDWEEWVNSGFGGGHVFRAPDETQVGLLSFEKLDEQLDLLEAAD